MNTNASLLTTAAKSTVDTSVDDYGAAVFDHVVNDWAAHTACSVYNNPYVVPTNFTTATKVTVTIYSNYVENTTTHDIALSGPIGSFTSNDIQFLTNYSNHWQPFGHPKYGAMMTGVISIKSAVAFGSFPFTLKSCQASYLWLYASTGPILVVNNGGAHGLATKTQSLNSAAPGNYPFVLKMYNKLFTASGVDLTLPTVTTSGGFPVTCAYLATGTPNPNKTVADSQFYMKLDYYDGTNVGSKGVAVPCFFSGTISPVAATPIITLQPQGKTVNVGDAAVFSVAALSDSGVTYQWYFAGNAISGATGSTLTLSSVSYSNAGAYQVAVSNANGSTMSNSVTLTVL